MVYGTRPSKDKSGAYLFLPDGKAKVLLSLSQRLYVRCLLASQEALIDSLLCIVSLYHAGVLGAGRQADWVLLHLLIDFFFLTQHSTKDSLEHSRHLWLHFSLSLLYSLIYLPTALSLLPAFSPTTRRSRPWCAWWRGRSSPRWWHTTSISSRRFA